MILQLPTRGSCSRCMNKSADVDIFQRFVTPIPASANGMFPEQEGVWVEVCGECLSSKDETR